VATHPWWAILGCFVIAGLSAIGLLEYRTENNAFKLWIPDNSEFLENYNFLQEKFPPDTRFNNFLVASDNNVLTPAIIKLVRNIFSPFIKFWALYQCFSTSL
jgi:predicted RND superfamily exporter protein